MKGHVQKYNLLYFKVWHPFVHGGMHFFLTQNAISRDWRVVGGSNLFWHRTLPTLFGVRTPSKSICTHAGTRLKNFDENLLFFSPNLAGARQGVSNIKIVQNLPIHLGSAQKPIYSDGIHLKLIICPKNRESKFSTLTLGILLLQNWRL